MFSASDVENVNAADGDGVNRYGRPNDVVGTVARERNVIRGRGFERVAAAERRADADARRQTDRSERTSPASPSP